MFYYDLKLGLIAALLTLFRALLIISTSAIRLYHETKHFNLQGKIGGFVLQLISGSASSASPPRPSALWRCGRDSSRRRSSTSSPPSVPPTRSAFLKSSFPPVATLIIFAAAVHASSKLVARHRRLSRFLRRIRPIDGIGRIVGRGVSEALIASLILPGSGR